MPDPFTDRDLHQKLLDADPTAPLLIIEHYLEGVVTRLRARFPNLADPAFVEEAAHTTFLNYLHQPSSYNPDKSPLSKVLYFAARADLLNLLAQEQRRRNRQPVRLDHVELSGPDAEYLVDNSTNPDQLEFESPDFVEQVRQVLPNPIDQQLVWLMMDGERRTTVYARALGITSLPSSEQEAHVKRHKDRIKKRLQRARIWPHDS
jgi:hypothetical protein